MDARTKAAGRDCFLGGWRAVLCLVAHQKRHSPIPLAIIFTGKYFGRYVINTVRSVFERDRYAWSLAAGCQYLTQESLHPAKPLLP